MKHPDDVPGLQKLPCCDGRVCGVAVSANIGSEQVLIIARDGEALAAVWDALGFPAELHREGAHPVTVVLVRDEQMPPPSLAVVRGGKESA